MAHDRDDALNWDGDDDPTLDVGGARARPAPAGTTSVSGSHEVAAAEPALPDGFTAVGRGRERVGRLNRDGTVTAPGERVPLGNAALITLGVLGGIHLLYILGWVVGGLRLQGAAQYLVTDVMFQGSLWLAIVSPALWFGAVLLLTRHARTWVRLTWLIAGVVLLVPWPFIMVGAVGQ